MPAISNPLKSSARCKPGSGPALRPYGAAAFLFNAIAWASIRFAALAGILIAAMMAAGGALAGPAAAAQTGSERPVILAFGDSLTAGYGLPRQDSFPAQLEAALAEDGIPARVVNAGVSGETTAGGAARIDWLLQEKPDLVIVELGANDALRGVDPAVTRANLDRIVEAARASGARVLLAGMMAPPNLGRDYSTAFNAIFPELAEKHGVVFYPFFLDGVAADPALNLGDGMHPNAEGIAAIVAGILPLVKEMLEESGAGRRGATMGKAGKGKG